jgi:type II secretory pathway pseudopilin PulG
VSTQRESEAGFTLVELMITMMIAMTVMASILGVLVSQSNAERRVSSFADNQEQLRQAMVLIQRDIRSAEPLEKLPASAAPPNQPAAVAYALRIDLNVFESVTAPPVPISWKVDTTARELRRVVRNADGSETVTYKVVGVFNDYAMDNELFAFYKANGDRYVLTAASTDDIAHCAVRIRTRLLAAPNRGPAPGLLHSDAQLRNRLPGGIGCPQFPTTNNAEQ